MPMRFSFFFEDLDGASVQLFEMVTIMNANQIPIIAGTATVTNGSVTFPGMPLPNFTIRLRDGDIPFVRSGVVDLSSGNLNAETGDFVSAYFLIKPDNPVVISPAEVSGMVPSLPLTSEDEDGNPEFRLDTLTLTVTGDTITAVGTGQYLQVSIGGLVNFVYTFRLKPSLDPVNVGRILRVETVSGVVSSADGSWIGFLINLVGNFMLWIMRDAVVANIEKSIQADIDEAVQENLAEAGVEAEVTVTAMQVTIDPITGILVRPLAAVNASAVCPAGLTAGSVRLRPADQMRALAAMRDKVLRGAPRGELYLRMFEQYKFELLWILISHPSILKQTDVTVAAGLRDFNAKYPERGVMSEVTAREAVRLMENVARVASPELAVLIQGLIPEVREFVGTPVGKLFERKR